MLLPVFNCLWKITIQHCLFMHCCMLGIESLAIYSAAYTVLMLIIHICCISLHESILWGFFGFFFFSCAHWFSTGRSLSRSILFFNLNHLKKKQSHLGSSHFLFRHIPAPLIILVFKLFLFDVKKSKKSCALLWAHKTFTLWIFNVFEDDSNIRCMLISPESNNELFLHISYILL